MNKSILFSALLALGLAGFGGAASAQDSEGNTAGRGQFYHPVAVDKIMTEVNHLNHMMTQVERELRTYRAPKPIWREYEHVRQEAAQINLQLRSKAIDQSFLRREVERMHKELRHIEEELHVPARESYQWR